MSALTKIISASKQNLNVDTAVVPNTTTTLSKSNGVTTISSNTKIRVPRKKTNAKKLKSHYLKNEKARLLKGNIGVLIKKLEKKIGQEIPFDNIIIKCDSPSSGEIDLSKVMTLFNIFKQTEAENPQQLYEGNDKEYENFLFDQMPQQMMKNFQK